jgi:hypothetical protein
MREGTRAHIGRDNRAMCRTSTATTRAVRHTRRHRRCRIQDQVCKNMRHNGMKYGDAVRVVNNSNPHTQKQATTTSAYPVLTCRIMNRRRSSTWTRAGILKQSACCKVGTRARGDNMKYTDILIANGFLTNRFCRRKRASLNARHH